MIFLLLLIAWSLIGRLYTCTKPRQRNDEQWNIVLTTATTTTTSRTQNGDKATFLLQWRLFPLMYMLNYTDICYLSSPARPPRDLWSYQFCRACLSIFKSLVIQWRWEEEEEELNWTDRTHWLNWAVATYSAVILSLSKQLLYWPAALPLSPVTKTDTDSRALLPSGTEGKLIQLMDSYLSVFKTSWGRVDSVRDVR